MSLLPSKPDLVSDSEPRVVGVDSDDADALMSALSSGTARRLLSELHEEPAPPAELAKRADTTLQNAQYHLANLSDAGAVEVVGTAYSEKGREMDVYAPADQPLVIFAGQEEEASGLRAALSRLVSGVGALLVGSLAIQEVFGDGIGRLVGFGATGGDGAEPAPRDRGEGGAAPDGDGSGGGGDAGTSTATPGESRATTEKSSGGADGASTGGPEAEATDAAVSPTPGDVSIYESDASGTVTEAATETAAPAQETTAAATQTPAPTPTPTPEATQVAADGGTDVVASLPPGALFFLGGLTVLVVGVALTYRR